MVGVIVTETGVSSRTALAEYPEFAVLVAVTVTVCIARITDGAVYTPFEDIEPSRGVIVQTIPVVKFA